MNFNTNAVDVDIVVVEHQRSIIVHVSKVFHCAEYFQFNFVVVDWFYTTSTEIVRVRPCVLFSWTKLPLQVEQYVENTGLLY